MEEERLSHETDNVTTDYLDWDLSNIDTSDIPILNNPVDLYLECQDDECYSIQQVQQTSTIGPSLIGQNVNLRITFPEKPSASNSKKLKKIYCLNCGKFFKTDKKLKDHLKEVHKVEKPYQCTQCHFKTTCLKLLNRHTKRCLKRMGISGKLTNKEIGCESQNSSDCDLNSGNKDLENFHSCENDTQDSKFSPDNDSISSDSRNINGHDDKLNDCSDSKQNDNHLSKPDGDCDNISSDISHKKTPCGQPGCNVSDNSEILRKRANCDSQYRKVDSKSSEGSKSVNNNVNVLSRSCDNRLKSEIKEISEDTPIQLNSDPNIGLPEKLVPLDKPFQCNSCSFRTRTTKLLKCHIETKHNSSRSLFSCKICDFHCKQQRTLKNHKKIHDEPAPKVTCDICQKQYISSEKLKRHKLTHTDNRPFKCTLCSKLFKLKGNLNDHMKYFHLKTQVKSNMKTLNCTWEGCDRKFRDNHNLKRHFNTHVKAVFKCNLCVFQCVYDKVLKKHKQKYHTT